MKRYLRWVILGGTLFFLAKTLKDNAAEAAAIRISGSSWGVLAIAFFVTLFAHIWSGWVWTWILGEFDRPVPVLWGLQVYLKTNIAKYLPGNVWHFYGRISAIAGRGVPLSVATLSVVLEPLLMAAAALMIAAIGSKSVLLYESAGIWQVISLVAVLMGVHPRILNPVMQYASKLKLKRKAGIPPLKRAAQEEDKIPCPQPHNSPEAIAVGISRYPLLPLMGELGFLLLRGTGFILTIEAMIPKEAEQIAILYKLPLLFSAFSFAWLLGLVVPGAPGGIGVFEATAIALLKGHFSAAVLLGAIALYRLISVLAEAAGAGLAWVFGRVKGEW